MPTPSVINNWRYNDAIPRRYWDGKYFSDTFKFQGVTAAYAGGAATGGTGDHNVLFTKFNPWEWNVIGTQTILVPSIDTFGLNLVQDAAVAGDGIELCMGQTSLSSASFLIGTDAAFFMRCNFKVEDASGCNPLIIGLRKAQAFDATLANYTDFVSIGIVGTANPNTIKLQTQIATGGVVTTDTTQTWADGATHSLSIFVSAAGVVTYQIDDAAPTATAAYTFANAINVIPFIRFTQAADITTQASIDSFQLGYQS